jgi:hypothetical protein
MSRPIVPAGTRVPDEVMPITTSNPPPPPTPEQINALQVKEMWMKPLIAGEALVDALREQSRSIRDQTPSDVYRAVYHGRVNKVFSTYMKPSVVTMANYNTVKLKVNEYIASRANIHPQSLVVDDERANSVLLSFLKYHIGLKQGIPRAVLDRVFNIEINSTWSVYCRKKETLNAACCLVSLSAQRPDVDEPSARRQQVSP